MPGRDLFKMCVNNRRLFMLFNNAAPTTEITYSPIVNGRSIRIREG
jgi:hypothetical protein